mgnify:CR=1 FL=1|jgi:siroheme synthase-like protein
MAYYPVMLNVKGKRCLVVGGGRVACRKVVSLLECGAVITVIAPEIGEGIRELWEDGSISAIERSYKKGDLEGFFIAVAASDDRDVNRLIAEEAAEKGILVNVVDDRELSSFIVPSIVRRGDLTVAIATNGKSPLLSKMLRKKLEEILIDEYGELLNMLEEARVEAKAQKLSRKEKLKLYESIIEGIKLF